MTGRGWRLLCVRQFLDLGKGLLQTLVEEYISGLILYCGRFFSTHAETHLYVGHLHARALFAHENVIDIHQDVALQGHGEPLSRQKGHSIHEHQLVQPEDQVVAKQDPLDAVVEPQVLHHRREQSSVLPNRRNALRRLGLGQQHGLVRRVVGLENGPVVPGEGSWQGLPGSGDEEQGGLGVDRAVLQTQVRVEEEGEAFQLGTEQTVFIGLNTRGTETRERNHTHSSKIRVMKTEVHWI